MSAVDFGDRFDVVFGVAEDLGVADNDFDSPFTGDDLGVSDDALVESSSSFCVRNGDGDGTVVVVVVAAVVLGFETFFFLLFFGVVHGVISGNGTCGEDFVFASKEKVIPFALAHSSCCGGTGAFPAPHTDWSKSMTHPVIMPDSSLAQKAMHRATSSGCKSRPKG